MCVFVPIVLKKLAQKGLQARLRRLPSGKQIFNVLVGLNKSADEKPGRARASAASCSSKCTKRLAENSAQLLFAAAFTERRTLHFFSISGTYPLHKGYGPRSRYGDHGQTIFKNHSVRTRYGKRCQGMEVRIVNQTCRRGVAKLLFVANPNGRLFELNRNSRRGGKPSLIGWLGPGPRLCFESLY